MATIKNTFSYNTNPEQVYRALTEEGQVKQWWTPDTHLETTVEGKGRFEFNPYGDYCVVKITALEPDKVVEWQCVDGMMMSTDEWVWTTIRFVLAANDDGGTNLTFAHDNWQAETACFKECTQGWAHFLGKSLKEYLETGKGDPFKPS